MNLRAFSDALFAIGRRYPRLPLETVRRLPLPLLHRLRQPGLRQTFADASRAPYYREAFAAAGVDPRRVRRPEDLGRLFLTADVVKARPESLLAGEPELAIESSGTSGRVSRVYLGRGELEYAARHPFVQERP